MNSELLSGGFPAALAEGRDKTLNQLASEFGIAEELLDTPSLYAAPWEERLVEFYSVRITPILKAAGHRGTEIREYLHDPRSVEDVSKVGAVALLVAMLIGEEPASVANVVAFSLALITAVSRQPKA